MVFYARSTITVISGRLELRKANYSLQQQLSMRVGDSWNLSVVQLYNAGTEEGKLTLLLTAVVHEGRWLLEPFTGTVILCWN